MDEAKNHILNKEFCLFDEKVKRCNGFVILTASVYHPKSRKLVARTDSRYNIQLQVAYKAFVNGAGKGEKGLSLLEKQHKATRDQIRKPRQLAEALIREDLCDEDHTYISFARPRRTLYVPYKQNFVTETMFYFCSKQQCINKMPHWTNLKPSDRIRADSSFTEVVIEAFKDNGLPMCNSVE